MTTNQPEAGQVPAVIEKPTGAAVAAYIPTTFAEAMKLATVIFKSGLAPETLRSEGAVFVAMAHGAELGLKPMQAIRLVNVIKGKPTLSADGIVAVILASGVCDYFEPVDESPKAVTWRTRRKGQEEKRATFTIEEAQQAGLINDMYRKWPKRMLSARCKAFLGRDVYPDIVGGLYTPEEVSEIPTTAERITTAVEERVIEPVQGNGSEPSVLLMSHEQRKAMYGARKEAGLATDPDGLKTDLSTFLNRPVAHSGEVTAEEADAYLVFLKGLPKAPAQGELAGTQPRRAGP